MPPNSVDLFFCDPPYNLSTKWEITANGKPDVKGSAKDFMNKWGGLDGTFLEEWFSECNRILKFGGRVIMFGIDRQLFPFEYYGNLAGLDQQQSLYWYFASSMPKTTDLSKQLDKYFGAEREVVGKYMLPNGKDWNLKQANDDAEDGSGGTFTASGRRTLDITSGTHELAKKYDGYKYSVVPIKQTNETILIFQKPYKTGSCLHDVLAYENGDDECLCGALDIDGSRVKYTPDNQPIPQLLSGKREINSENGMYGRNSFNESITKSVIGGDLSGRFPAQTFVDDESAKILDIQSGNRMSGRSNGSADIGESGNTTPLRRGTLVGRNDDELGCSKILHRCNFDEDVDFDLYLYCPKVNNDERELGMDGFEYSDKIITTGKGLGNTLPSCPVHNKGLPSGSNHYSCGCKQVHDSEQGNRRVPIRNNHPTIKPLSLMYRILQLFKTPNKQVLFDSFCGSGTIPMICEILDIDWIATEINEDYVKIANARIQYARNNKESLKARCEGNKPKKNATKSKSVKSDISSNEYF